MKLEVIIWIPVALSAKRYVIGVDGGATKTVALIGDENGKVLGRGEAGPSNYHNIGPTAAGLAIKEAVTKARRQVKFQGVPAIAVVALAAIDSARDRAIVRQFLRDIRIAKQSIAIHDSIAALNAATQGKPGIIIIAGTGCVAAGINSAGKYVRVGGWGYLIDDEGSGYDIGAKALRSAFRMLDGRAPNTKLMNALKKRFRVRTLEDALSLIYSDRSGVDTIAGLTPIVAKLSSSDQVCRRILNNAGISLAESACVVAKQLRMTHDAFTVTLVGGAFKAGKYLLHPLQARIRSECPRARVRIMEVEPVFGALSIAVSKSLPRSQLSTAP